MLERFLVLEREADAQLDEVRSRDEIGCFGGASGGGNEGRSRMHSSIKLGRDTEIGCFGGVSGGANAGSYGSDGSQRTPK